jgi:hypothetical protein
MNDGDSWINLMAEEDNTISYFHGDAQNVDTDITQLTLENDN